MIENKGIFVQQSIIDQINSEFKDHSPSKRKVYSKPYTMEADDNFSSLDGKENMDENERKRFRVNRIKNKVRLTSVD